jgi:hypothetical protein
MSETTTATEINWVRTGSKSYRVEIRRSRDIYPPSWNRLYMDGVLAAIWTPDGVQINVG